MDNKKSTIMWGSLLILFLVMIFIEIKINKNHDLENTDDEMIYLSYSQEPVMLAEPTVDVIDEIVDKLESHPEEMLIAVNPDLGRLAVTSVMINKKPSANLKVEKQEELSSNLANQQQDLAYKIFQGQRFNAVLTHAIHSDLPGMVVAEISQNIYGYQSYIPLLPVGTRLIGSYNNRLNIGDTRLYIVWQRAITPEGIDIQLESIGNDRLGQTGISGTVDTHFWEIFGTSSLLSVMAVGTSNLSEDQGELSNQYQQGVTDALMDTSGTILQNRISRKPTIHITQGEIIHVMVAKDLDFSQVLQKTQQIPIF